MKDFLEALELGEEKLKLSKEEVKTILAKHGEYIKTETEKVENRYKEQLEGNKAQIDELKAQIEKAPKTDEIESLKTTIAEMEAKEKERLEKESALKREEALTKNIQEALGDKKFVNDFTKNAIIGEIKNAYNDYANEGKSIKDLFEEITKDKSGIFANPNQIVDMPSVDENVENAVSKDEFDKMGYKERVELKRSNPELFNKYNK